MPESLKWWRNAMRAVDTNILARLILADDPAQTALARSLFERDSIYVPITVLLELEWVLRSASRHARGDVVTALQTLRGQPNVTIEDDAQVAEALSLAQAGTDFADALHLVRSRHCVDFVTFDQAFATAVPDVVTLLNA
jgi:predicted nucleic-acid-binding protein